jgi:hypothetical protein
MLLDQIVSECVKIAPVRPTGGPSPVSYQTSATAPQIKFYTSLIEGKDLTDKQRDELNKSFPTLTKYQMSKQIQWLLGLPWKKRTNATNPASAPVQKVPQGNYAVVDPADQILKFYSVRCPKKGKWAGYSFMRQISGGNMLQMTPTDRYRIFVEIAKDTTGALKRYGQAIGECGHCRKQLTDQVSRQFGIGPVCRKVLGI